jgi:hypothetical protein
VVADAGLSSFSLVGLAALLAIAAIVMRGGWSSTRALALRSQAALGTMAPRRASEAATCRSCNGPLHPSDFFCASCGDARYRLIRPQR